MLLTWHFSGYHGSDGPWKVSRFDTTPALQEMFFNASRELGLKLTDVNGAEQEGNSFPLHIFQKLQGVINRFAREI